MAASSWGGQAVDNSSPAENLTSNRLSGRRAGRQTATTPVKRSNSSGATVPAAGRVLAGGAGSWPPLPESPAGAAAVGRGAVPNRWSPRYRRFCGRFTARAARHRLPSRHRSANRVRRKATLRPRHHFPERDSASRSSAACVATWAICRWASASTSRYSSPSGRASEKISANSLTFSSTSRTSGSNCWSR